MIYQRPIIAGLINNVIRRQKCNSLMLNTNNSNLRLRGYLFQDFRNSGLVNQVPSTSLVRLTSSTRSANTIELEENRVAETGDNMKPTAPDPETCCETGCVNCVWIKYVEELQNYYPNGLQDDEVKDILKQIHDPLVRSFVKMELGM